MNDCITGLLTYYILFFIHISESVNPLARPISF